MTGQTQRHLRTVETWPGDDPLAELARLIGSTDSVAARGRPGALQVVPSIDIDAHFHIGSILCGYEHLVALPMRRDAFAQRVPDPARDAFFYRDIHAFRIAEN